MDNNTDGKADLTKLSKREDFPGFKEPMDLCAMEKGDTEGIYSYDGSDPTVGYQAIPAAHVNRRRDWMLLSGKLTDSLGVSVYKSPTQPCGAHGIQPFRQIETLGSLTLAMKLLFFSKQFKYDRFEQIGTLRPNATIP